MGELFSVKEQNNLENLGEERETVSESLNLILLPAHITSENNFDCFELILEIVTSV